MKVLSDLGVLRLALAVVVLALIGLAPFTGGPARYEGFGFVVTVLAPAFAVVMLFVLPLDMVMSVVFMSDRQGPERARMRRVLWIEVVLLIALLASWTPFLAELLERGG